MAHDIVVFPDSNLEKVIRAEDVIIGKKAITSPYITKADLESITWCRGQGENISDLSGLEYCINLESLDLSHNNIVDLTPVAGLTGLSRLNLSHNQIDDIRALSGLYDLKELDLEENKIDNIDTLVNFPELVSIDLSRNNISDMSALSGLTHLEQIILGHNNITDITPLVENSGISSVDVIDFRNNPLNEEAYREHLPRLKNAVHLVLYDEESVPQKGFSAYWWIIAVVAAIIIVLFFVIHKRNRQSKRVH